MSLQQPDIVEEFPLRKLSKDESFAQTCSAFVTALKLGVCVMDLEGNVVADVRYDNEAHCQLFNTSHEGRRHCSNTLELARSIRFESADQPQELSCPSGLKYWVSPILFGGELLGKTILGPIRSWEDCPTSDERLKILGSELAHSTASAAETMQLIVGSIGDVVSVWNEILESFLNLYFRLHLTSQLHLATMDAAYNELKERNAELEASNKELAELEQSKSNFIATISHELKTPLTSIIGYAEMLAEGLVGPIHPEQKRPLMTILEKGEHLLELIEQLLDLAKSDLRESRFDLAEIEVSRWLDRSVSDVRPQAERKGIQLLRDQDPAAPLWRGDFRRLRRVLTNLLSNAVKFTPDGGQVTLRTRVQSMEPQDIFAVNGEPSLVVEVEDSGIGIAEEDLDRIFEAFVQVDNSATREFGGTGLGLVIVKKFVEEHGGRVSVRSTVGRGTVFTCSFPANPPSQGETGEL